MRLLASGSVLLAGFLAGGVASSSAPLAAQQLRYSLRPTVTWTEWDEALGLENARFLGGSAGLGFGEYVDVTAFYVKSDDRSTHLSSLPFAADMGSPLPDQYLNVASYGTELSLVLARGPFVPVLMGGAGILRFRPQAGDDIQRIQLKYGVGFRTFVLDAFEAEVMVERSRYYLDPLDLAAPASVGDPALPEDPGAGTLRRNLALRAGLGLQLGGRDSYARSDLNRAGDRRYRRSSSGAALTLEPFGGQQAFDPGFGIEDQDIAGFRAGFDLGPFVGLRGFYWRGTDGQHAWEEGIRGYGGEAQFSLGGLAMFSPHLLAGAGRMEFGPDLARDAEGVPADRTTLIVGGGVDLGLGRHLRLTAAARDHIMSGPELDGAAVDFEDVKDPRDLVHNWQMSAGLKILVGGDRRSRRDRPRERRAGAAAVPAKPNARLLDQPGRILRSRATGPGRHRAGVERLLRRQRPTMAHPERRRGSLEPLRGPPGSGPVREQPADPGPQPGEVNVSHIADGIARRCILNFVRRPARAFPFLRRLLPGGRAIRRSRLADSVPGAADARGSRVQRQRRPLPVTGDRGAWAVPS